MNDPRIDMLFSKNQVKAYKILKELLQESDKNNSLYGYIGTYFEMLHHDNSYVRNRGIFLIAANAKWDIENKIDDNINAYLACMEDDNPITSRQCIKEVVKIAKYKPQILAVIIEALQTPTIVYADSMQSLIMKDRKMALRQVTQYMDF